MPTEPSPAKSTIGWKLFVILNVAALVGVVAATFLLVPPKTPVWIWASSAAVFIAIMNYGLWSRIRARRVESSRSIRIASTIAILGFIFFVFDLIFHFYKR